MLAACGSQLPSALKIISGSKALAFPRALRAHVSTLAAYWQQLTDMEVQVQRYASTALETSLKHMGVRKPDKVDGFLI